MKNIAKILILVTSCILIASLSACSVSEGNAITEGNSSTSNSDSTADAARSENWDEYTHGNNIDADYAVVLPQDTVNRIDITLSPDAWSDLQTEMEDQFGAFGTGMDYRGQMPNELPGIGGQGEFPFPQGTLTTGELPENVPDRQGFPEGFQPSNQPQEGFRPDRGDFPAGGNMGVMDLTENTYVSSTITFNDETWNSVGFRYSGNSTLRTSWSTGTLKISFRLDFDEFEDQDPSTTDQRFYGFKQLSFKSNAMDDSYIREKVTADIFREAGVVSPQTAFYEVYIDYGEGPTYFGVFTAVEVVDDTLIKTQFTDDSGNVYKPDGTGATFQDGTFSEESFEKETNQDAANWSDIQAVFAILNSDLRTSDPAAWHAQLEAVFDVDAFIRWLAVDTIIQNWDTYGSMAHNYYLYTDPEDGLVTWIPWDNNMALGDQSMQRRNDDRSQGVRDLDVTTISDEWPLISYLMDDPIYLAQYQQYLKETIQSAWLPDELALTYQKYHDLIAPYVKQEIEGFSQSNNPDNFDNSLSELITHAQQRYLAVNAYLADQ